MTKAKFWFSKERCSNNSLQILTSSTLLEPPTTVLVAEVERERVARRADLSKLFLWGTLRAAGGAVLVGDKGGLGELKKANISCVDRLAPRSRAAHQEGNGKQQQQHSRSSGGYGGGK